MELKLQNQKFQHNFSKTGSDTVAQSSSTSRQRLVEKGLKFDGLLTNKRDKSISKKKVCFTKDPVLAVSVSSNRAASLEKSQNLYQKKPEKPVDVLSKITSKLSIKKLNELYRISLVGDCLVCRALLALLSEVDYHISESQNFTIELFFEYISTPGIVIQTIKRIPELVTHDKIPLSSYQKALELFNQALELSPIPAVNILAELFQVIFPLKGLNCKLIDVKYEDKPIVSRHRPVQSAEISNKKPVQEKPVIRIQNFEETCKVSPLRSEIAKSSPRKNRFDDEFMLSKSELLGKFYSKMGLDLAGIIEREKSPAKDFLNKSIEYPQVAGEEKGYIKVKKSQRSSSLTPTSSSSTRSRVLKENKAVKKEKIEEVKKKNFLLGSRFYKRIDQKFVETLLEKMKRDPVELKKLKSTNFEEYSKKKNFHVSSNKAKWVVDTVRVLETSDLLHPANENDLGQDERHEAVLVHLSQEQHVNSLIRRAEQQELASRRLASN